MLDSIFCIVLNCDNLCALSYRRRETYRKKIDSLYKTTSIKRLSTVSRLNRKPLTGLLDVNHVMSN